MQITAKIKIMPSSAQETLIENTLCEYIALVNAIVEYQNSLDNIPRMSSASVHAPLPSALRNQCIRDAKSIYSRFLKNVKAADKWNTKHPHEETRVASLPTLKRPVAIWNNQNYHIDESSITFPVYDNGRCKQITVAAIIPAETGEILRAARLGTLRVTRKSHKLIAQIAYDVPCKAFVNNGNTMGVDLGLKCPAVCVTNDADVLFAGNGRRNKYLRRHYKAKRKELGKAKKTKALITYSDKEQRIMRDTDHKISRQIVDFAEQHNISVLRMEKLDNIRKTAKTSRKNSHNLHTWSFYRLAQYIEYKAHIAGIAVEYVEAAYTSQICPVCGAKNHAKDRDYVCKCGFRQHRDLVGARNIIVAPVAGGK